jgi:hypothetical protein
MQCSHGVRNSFAPVAHAGITDELIALVVSYHLDLTSLLLDVGLDLERVGRRNNEK